MKPVSAFKKRLALPQTSWQLCLLAIFGGLFAALLIILFTLTIDGLEELFKHQVGQYISFDALSRFLIPIAGVSLILAMSWLTGYQYIRSGIPFVLHRLKIAYGVIPFRNTLNQFWGGAVALAAGFSVGREGPAVHIGAAGASYVGNKLNLPYNSIRTLCASGIAAAIAATFNTPIAAVMFVMEVILREYKIHIFIPIMLASIIGSMVTSSVYGPVHEFDFFSTLSLDHSIFPYLVLLGILLGALASAFNHSLIYILDKFKRWPIVIRLGLAAIITGLFALFAPVTIDPLHSEVSLALGLDINEQWKIIGYLLIAKILMTLFAIGLGIPGGMIGPILAIGALTGITMSIAIGPFLDIPNVANDMALMGMAGFMAATLNAPLAALLAVVELSKQLEVVVPAMIVISTACLISGQFFNNRSIFIMQLNLQNLPYRKPPLETSLQRIGVIGIMQERLKVLKSDRASAQQEALTTSLEEYVINQEQDQEDHIHYYWHQHLIINNVSKIDTYQLKPISSQATLAEAYLALKTERCGGVYIYQQEKTNIIGMISFEQIRSYLHEGKLT